MYLFHRRDCASWHYSFRILGVQPAGARDQTAYTKAVELGRCVWLKVKKNSSDPDSVSRPEVVWRSPLESIQNDPVEAVSVDLGIHQPDETAEYEFYRLTEHEE